MPRREGNTIGKKFTYPVTAILDNTVSTKHSKLELQTMERGSMFSFFKLDKTSLNMFQILFWLQLKGSQTEQPKNIVRPKKKKKEKKKPFFFH